jgi:acid phosphatase (class A)
MRPSRRFLLGAALAGLIAAPLLAAPRALAGEPPYLTAHDLDLTMLLPPPPPIDSARQAQDLAAVLAAQREASPQRVAQAAADTNETVFDMFGATLGARFVSATLPRVSELFLRLGETEASVVDPVKPVFDRPRPYLADPRAKPLVRASRSGSFPSGHATRVTLVAIVLAAMLPEQRAAIWARADDYAQSRVIGGMHYPLDLDGGRRAGTAIAALLFAHPAFRADFDAARTELRAALALDEPKTQ